MKFNYRDYIIEVVDDPSFSISSADNISHYDKVYFEGNINEDRAYPTSKHGIRVLLGNEEIYSALICDVGGAITIHNRSCTISDNTLLICCCDKVYCMNLPDLAVNWSKRFDPVTCFGIHPIDNDFLIHGELQISRIDKNGNELWSFGGRDIWVTQNETEACKIVGDKILLTDWGGNQYSLDYNGIEIGGSSMSPGEQYDT